MKVASSAAGAAAGAMTGPPVFVYGTLMSPQVVSMLLGRPWSPAEEVAIRPARLYGYTRHPVRNHVFPATIPAATTAATNAQSENYVQGLLLPDTLSKTELDIFDWFESDEYNRVHVTVSVEDKKRESNDPASTAATTSAQVYLWRDDLIPQLELEKEWSYDDFCRDHLDWYLENTVRPCRSEVVRLGMTAEAEENKK